VEIDLKRYPSLRCFSLCRIYLALNNTMSRYLAPLRYRCFLTPNLHHHSPMRSRVSCYDNGLHFSLHHGRLRLPRQSPRDTALAMAHAPATLPASWLHRRCLPYPV